MLPSMAMGIVSMGCFYGSFELFLWVVLEYRFRVSFLNIVLGYSAGRSVYSRRDLLELQEACSSTLFSSNSLNNPARNQEKPRFSFQNFALSSAVFELFPLSGATAAADDGRAEKL